MTSNTIFIPDANVFMEASRRYYAFDIAPPFWEALSVHIKNQHIIIIDRIMSEIKKGKDELAEWIENFESLCKSTGEDDVIDAYRDIMTWSYNQTQFNPEAKSEFASCADGWLIAYAKAKGLIVVTHEAFNKEIKKRIPIPNVCVAFNVQYINTFDMLRRLGIKFSDYSQEN